jgi:hypothetical protein
MFTKCKKGYHNASGEGWTVTDKIFGYIDKAVNIYNKGRKGTVSGDSGVDVSLDNNKIEEKGLFGLTKPWGAVIAAGVGLAAIFIVYKATK